MYILYIHCIYKQGALSPTKQEKIIMNKSSLKITSTIFCDTCNCKMKKTKTIKVNATTESDAKIETKEKIENWKKSLKKTDCRICKSIKNSV